MKEMNMTIKGMLNLAITKYFEFKSKEIILVCLDDCECVSASEPAGLCLNTSWNEEFDVIVTSVRNDHGHISITYKMA